MTEWCSCNKLRIAEAKANCWESIVKCKDCVHFREHKFTYYGVDGVDHYCTRWDEKHSCEYIYIDVSPDGFCAWGERRDA